jgi:hypothetical protein
MSGRDLGTMTAEAFPGYKALYKKSGSDPDFFCHGQRSAAIHGSLFA